jgi:hypothetical protein
MFFPAYDLLNAETFCPVTCLKHQDEKMLAPANCGVLSRHQARPALGLEPYGIELHPIR